MVVKAEVKPKQRDRESASLGDAQEGVRRKINEDSRIAGGTSAFSEGVHKTGIEISAGDSTRVLHGLKKIPKGWWVTRITHDGSGEYPRESEVSSDSVTLYNEGGDDIKIDVWIF